MTETKEYYVLDTDALKVTNFKYDSMDRLNIKGKRFSKRLIKDYINDLKIELPVNSEVMLL